MSFPMKHFDLTLPSNGAVSISLIGASRSGKSTMMKYLYREHFTKHITVLFTMNPQAPIYKDFTGTLLTTDQYNGDLIADAHVINKGCGNKWPFLFISDDYVDTKIKNCPEITRALTIYRNTNISTIFSFQGRTLMNAVGRNNTNFIFIFKQQTPLEFEAVIKEYLSMWLPPDMSMREMIDFVMRATQDHHFFFIDNIAGECYLSKLDPYQFAISEG
jgi:hypothetical protein